MTLIWRCDGCGAERTGSAHPPGWRVVVVYTDEMCRRSTIRHECGSCRSSRAVAPVKPVARRAQHDHCDLILTTDTEEEP